MNYFNYFTEIEDTFIRRRGKHLLLSTLDWALIESWKEMGVPLHVALRGIEQSFDSYEARPRRRSVKSLMYCQEEVEAQFAEWLEGQRGASAAAAGGGDPTDGAGPGRAETDGAQANGSRRGASADDERVRLPFPRAVILAHLAEARAALGRALGGRRQQKGEAELCEALARAAARLEELEADFARTARPDAEALENSLTDLEGLLDRALRACARPERVAEIRAVAEEQLRPYRKRMERATYEQTLENLLAKLLREEFDLPRLSLFYL